MKTPEEIKKGLECSITKRCIKTLCPYFASEDDEGECISQTQADALAYIKQLEEMAKPNEQIRWERDIAIGQLNELGVGFGEKVSGQLPKWISVEDERKPKHGQEYFIRYYFGIKGDEYNSHGPFYGAAKWYSAGSNGYADGPHFENEGMNEMFVTHWMEIPQVIEPPKEGEHE